MHGVHKNYPAVIWVALTVLIVSAVPISSRAADRIGLPDGSRLDLSKNCPVCGMTIGGKEGQGVTVTFKDGHAVGFAGVAAAVFKNGHVVGFEGARCLFIYNSVPQQFNVDVANIARQFVTDFTTKKMIELSKAFLVLGSNVKGPMGYDLIPFTTKEEAAKFASENEGKWIVQLHEIARPTEEPKDEPSAGVKEQGPQKQDTSASEKRPTKKKHVTGEAPEMIVVPRGSGHHHGH